MFCFVFSLFSVLLSSWHSCKFSFNFFSGKLPDSWCFCQGLICDFLSGQAFWISPPYSPAVASQKWELVAPWHMHLPTNTCSQEIFFMCINDTCIHLGATSQSYGVIFDSCFHVIPISSLISHTSTRYSTSNHISLAPLLLP